MSDNTYYVGFSVNTDDLKELPNGERKAHYYFGKYKGFDSAKGSLMGVLVSAMEDAPDQDIMLELLRAFTDVAESVTQEPIDEGKVAFLNIHDWMHIIVANHTPADDLDIEWEMTADHTRCTDDHCYVGDEENDDDISKA